MKIAKLMLCNLSAVGAIGAVATGLTSANAALKAQNVLKETSGHLSFEEELALTWKQWAVPVSICLGTVACILTAGKVSKTQIIAVSGGVAAFLTSLESFEKKIKKNIVYTKERVKYVKKPFEGVYCWVDMEHGIMVTETGKTYMIKMKGDD